MGIHWSLPLLADLLPAGLLTRLAKEATVDPSLDYKTPPTNGSRIYDGLTGKVVKELSSESVLLRVSRRKLRTFCTEGIDIKSGHTLDSFQCNNDGTTITATFRNGEKHTGTVLVGADGPRSDVRSHLLGPEKAKVSPQKGVVSISTIVQYGDAEKAAFVRSAHPVWSMMIHPEAFIFFSAQDIPSPQRPEDWRFNFVVNWKGEREESLTNDARLSLVKEKAAKLAEVCCWFCSDEAD